MTVTEIKPISKGKVQVSFDEKEALVLYKGEMLKFGLKEQMLISEELYCQLFHDIVGKRVIKRAMHLLEKMERTEQQLRKKLTEGGYPDELIEDAITYVKFYRYIDDERYAHTFVRLNQDRRSAGRMKMDLLAKGISSDIIEAALAEENETQPETLIQKWIEKKNFDPETATRKEAAKMYQFLLRKGFGSSEIMHVLNDRYL